MELLVERGNLNRDIVWLMRTDRTRLEKFDYSDWLILGGFILEPGKPRKIGIKEID
jgi:hypothetical protein